MRDSWLCFLLAWWAGVWVCSCAVDLKTPREAVIGCTTAADCTRSGDVCLEPQRVCLSAANPCVVPSGDHYTLAADGDSCASGNVCVAGECIASFCGDAILDLTGGEICDDGNLEEDDDCVLCLPATCGDGFVHAITEACDGGNAVGGDGCSADCTKIEVCGDNFLDTGEACDDEDDDPNNPNDGCDQCQVTTWDVEVVFGLGAGAALPLDTPLVPTVVAADRAGNILIGDTAQPALWRLDANNALTMVAAGTQQGACIDGVPATQACFTSVGGVALDERGNIYFSDGGTPRVLHIDSFGIVHFYAGTGGVGYDGDGGAAEFATFNSVGRLALARNGTLYVCDIDFQSDDDKVRRIAPDGMITTLATIPGLSAIALDADDTLYAKSSGGLYRVDDTGGLEAVVPTSGTCPDGSDAVSLPSLTPGMAFNANGELLLTNISTVLLLDTDGLLCAVAGTGTSGFSGDGGPALAAELGSVQDVAVDPAGRALIADRNSHRLRRVELDGTIGTIAGNGARIEDRPTWEALLTPLDRPAGIAVSPTGEIYVSEIIAHRVRRVAANVVTPFAGTGERASTGDGGPAVDAELMQPRELVFAGDGSLWISELASGNIRRVDSSGTITTVTAAGPAWGMALDRDGNLYVGGGPSAPVVTMIDTTGTPSVFAGSTSGYSGDGVAATNAQLFSVRSLAFSAGATAADDELYIADECSIRVVELATDTLRHIAGVFPTVAGDPCGSSDGDDGLAQVAHISPAAIATDGLGGLYVFDTDSSALRYIDAAGVIHAFSNSLGVSSGDFGPASEASFVDVAAMTVAGDFLFVTETSTNQVRRIGPLSGIPTPTTVTTVAGNVHPGDGDQSWGRLRDPRDLVAIPGGFLVADGVAARVRLLDDAFSRSDTVIGYPGGLADAVALAGQSRVGEIDDLAWDAATLTLYLADAGDHCIRAVSLSGLPSTWTLTAAFGTCGESGHRDANGSGARFVAPAALALIGRELFIADREAHVIRRANLDGSMGVDTVAGTPFVPGYCCEGVTAADSLFDSPAALASDDGGGLMVADTANNRVRRLAPETGGSIGAASVVELVLGDGSPGAGGSGSPSRYFPVHSPEGLAFDPFGNLMVAGGETVRLVTPGDESGAFDGSGYVISIYGEPPRSAFPQTATRCLSAVLPVGNDQVVLSDRCLGILIQLTRAQQ